MSVDSHPSRKPAAPKKPPATSTTEGTCNKVHSSGQDGVPYGFRHEINVKPSHKSELAHHFKDAYTGGKGGAGHPGKEAPNEGSVSRASRPGDEKSDDSPG
jgi:hypothetical protein